MPAKSPVTPVGASCASSPERVIATSLPAADNLATNVLSCLGSANLPASAARSSAQSRRPGTRHLNLGDRIASSTRYYCAGTWASWSKFNSGATTLQRRSTSPKQWERVGIAQMGVRYLVPSARRAGTLHRLP